MLYFLDYYKHFFNSSEGKKIDKIYKKKQSIIYRRIGKPLKGFTLYNASKYKPLLAYKFEAGDIVRVFFSHYTRTFMFFGICLGIRKKSLFDKSCSIILQNTIGGIVMKFVFSFYYLRAYRLIFETYRRKAFYYRKSKIYYITRKSKLSTRV